VWSGEKKGNTGSGKTFPKILHGIVLCIGVRIILSSASQQMPLPTSKEPVLPRKGQKKVFNSCFSSILMNWAVKLYAEELALK